MDWLGLQSKGQVPNCRLLEIESHIDVEGLSDGRFRFIEQCLRLMRDEQSSMFAALFFQRGEMYAR